MGVIKFILKWIGILLGLILALMIGIAIIGNINMKRERQEEDALQKSISAKQVVSGMTPDQVRMIWGSPTRITQSVVHGVQVEQWIYAATPPKYDNARYVGFREGKAAIISAEQPQP